MTIQGAGRGATGRLLLGESLFVTAEGDNKVLGALLSVLVRTF
jgi:hypothetical protein